MTWFRLDDGWLRHPKMRAAGRDGRALWVAMGTYAAGQETDGHILKSMVPLLAAEAEVKPLHLRKLIDAGLVEDAGDTWLLHDWLEYQPSRASLEEKRETNRERMNRWRNTKRSNGVTDTVTSSVDNGERDASVTLSPSRPVPTPIGIYPSNQLPQNPVDNPDDETKIQTEVDRRMATNPPRADPGTGPWRNYRKTIETEVRAQHHYTPPVVRDQADHHASRIAALRNEASPEALAELAELERETA